MGRILSEEELDLSLAATLSRVSGQDHFFLFAYGSLVWRPNFEYDSMTVAKIEGYHRSFCHLSPQARGSTDHPGLVLGLEPGGSCEGVLYGLTIADHFEQLRNLWRRELRTGSYQPQWISAILPDRRVADPKSHHGVERRTYGPHSQRLSTTLTFIVNQDHDQYVPNIDKGQLLRILKSAKGQYGTNLEYVQKTLESLRGLDIYDDHVEAIAAELSISN